MSERHSTRRQLLRTAGAVSCLAVAGCGSTDQQATESPTEASAPTADGSESTTDTEEPPTETETTATAHPDGTNATATEVFGDVFPGPPGSTASSSETPTSE